MRTVTTVVPGHHYRSKSVSVRQKFSGVVIRRPTTGEVDRPAEVGVRLGILTLGQEHENISVVETLGNSISTHIPKLQNSMSSDVSQNPESGMVSTDWLPRVRIRLVEFLVPHKTRNVAEVKLQGLLRGGNLKHGWGLSGFVVWNTCIGTAGISMTDSPEDHKERERAKRFHFLKNVRCGGTGGTTQIRPGSLSSVASQDLCAQHGRHANGVQVPCRNMKMKRLPFEVSCGRATDRGKEG
jgi:hypothetical protein